MWLLAWLAAAYFAQKRVSSSYHFSHYIAKTCPTTGGDEGARTPDPRLAKAVLSQLSYIPRGLWPDVWA